MVIDKSDKRTLMATPAFRRFLLMLVEMAGIFESSPTEDRMAFREGRRSLALEILRILDEVQQSPNPSGIPADTSIQLLREAVQSAVRDKPIGAADAYDELRDQDDAA